MDWPMVWTVAVGVALGFWLNVALVVVAAAIGGILDAFGRRER